jgi:acyl-CoA synthetase (AMP-forming)/AMP-acid ligase II/acyl carrier protein
MSMLSIVEVLEAWALSQPDKAAWSFLDDKGVLVDRYSYAELEFVTDELALYLRQDAQLSEGDRALLVFVPGLDFMVALLACFKARVIAVPVFPPDPFKLKKDMHHFVSIQSSSGANVVLTHAIYSSAKKAAKLSSFFSLSGNGGAKWPDHLTWLTVDGVIKKAKADAAKAKDKGSGSPARAKLPPRPKADEQMAFLQYTSGSTSEPKGVMISHNNLAHNQLLIAHELKTSEETVCVSWLPQYHDMGLIGSYLGTIQCGGRGIYMSSISFLKDPLLWLRTLSKYKGTHTQAPSFAFALTVRKLKELQRRGGSVELDLSSTQHMINAAEPVDPDAITAFYDSFSGKYGLPRGVVIPTYGLAEHTVFVCSGGKQMKRFSTAALEGHKAVAVAEDETAADKGVGASRMLVGCGFPKNAHDVDLRIVDAETCTQQEENCVGEVWVTSPSKAGGYWDRPEVSEEVFQAQLAGGGDGGTAGAAGRGYLRTGDLGFMHNDELFICGRIKDLLIVRGSNHYPQDIERTAESCDAMQGLLRAGRSAVFSAPVKGSAEEGLVLLAEIQQGVAKGKLEAAMEGCRDAVSSDHGVALSTVCLVQTRTIPKTTSGKIARAWCRREFLDKKLTVVAQRDFGDDTGTGDGGIEKGSGNGGNGAGAVSVSPEVGVVGDEGDANTGVSTSSVDMSDVIHFSSPEEVRAQTTAQLTIWLEKHLVLLSEDGPVPLTMPVDRLSPVSMLGLDSMCLVQFSGVIQNHLHCTVPDEFLFTTMATLEGIAEAAKLGRLTERQQAAMDGVESVEVVQTKQPLCPWFVCCY